MINTNENELNAQESTPLEKRGLASADAETRKRVASMGGKAAHQAGTAHEFNSDEAREAGRKGGQAVSRDRQHMSAIGREGGRNSRGNRDTSIPKNS